MDDRNATLRRGLLGIALMLVVVSALVAAAAWLLAAGLAANPAALQTGALAGVGLALGAMLIGCVPLWRLLSAGNEKFVAAVLAAMLVRMFLCVVGLPVLVKAFGLPAAISA